MSAPMLAFPLQQGEEGSDGLFFAKQPRLLLLAAAHIPQQNVGSGCWMFYSLSSLLPRSQQNDPTLNRHASDFSTRDLLNSKVSK